MKIYVIKIAVSEVSPMVWRRLRIAADTSLAALHFIFQIVQGWDNDYLHQFHIHGKDFGISYEGGICFPDNPFRLVIGDFAFDAGDHTHPALKYIETRWVSLISNKMTTRLLKDVLPDSHGFFFWFVGVECRQRCRVGATFIDSNPLGFAMITNGLAKEA
ncbi:Plasmid pRiA4b ORF-3-like protein [Yersinia intermedia]|uniref:Plasmid pRiA4b ORF-3-like protein n=1 Tax=Yersinia intermedia TaxID=631 RepID=A0A0H5LXB8_YERIN|nr:Plasmid pRiA4b ORF-3-like protein [Yersinia intermedia]